MLQDTFLQELRRQARAAKESICKKRPTDLSPFVMVYRGNDPIAQVIIGKVSGIQSILKVVEVAAGAFDADQVGVAWEGYVALTDTPRPLPEEYEGLTANEKFEKFGPKNPMTGLTWGEGEMEEAVKKHDAIGKGWVSECILLTAANRAGDMGSINLAFKFVGDRYLFWRDEKDLNWDTSEQTPGQRLSSTGVFPSRLAEIMMSPSLGQHLPADFPLDRDQRDLAAAKFIMASRTNAVQLFAGAEDTERRARIDHFERTGKISY